MSIQILIATGASFLFLIIEAILNLHRRSGKDPGTKRSDRGSLSLIWITLTVCLTIGFSFAEHGKWTTLNYVSSFTGLLFYCIGMFIRLRSVKQLDKAFTVDVAFREGQKLKTDGMYRLVRHPSYLGGLMIITGIALGMSTLISFLIVTIPVFLAFNYRMIVEERLLLESFGDNYREYAKKTKRIIPYIY